MKQPSLILRKLLDNELQWANERYMEIDFLPSPASDFIAIAEVDGKLAGLGRITRITEDIGELGGMYVLPQFRGMGVSAAMIRYLIAHGGLENLYCLPFEELRRLYMAAGFHQRSPDSSIPARVLNKHMWCNEHYAKPVLLMYRAAATIVAGGGQLQVT